MQLCCFADPGGRYHRFFQHGALVAVANAERERALRVLCGAMTLMTRSPRRPAWRQDR